MHVRKLRGGSLVFETWLHIGSCHVIWLMVLWVEEGKRSCVSGLQVLAYPRRVTLFIELKMGLILVI